MTNVIPSEPSPTLSDYRQMIERGNYCVEHDFDNEALRLFSEVCRALSEPTNDAEAELYMDAAAGLMALRQTDNEYVWEQSGPLLSDYFDWLDRRG